MQVFDASSMIYAWDNYPLRQFPRFWDWLAKQIKDNQLVMSVVAYEEVERSTPDCAAWLKGNDLERLVITNEILQHSLRIKALLGIADDHYHPKGVGENDIFIIATALVHHAELVTEEGRQAVAPTEPAKRRIPAVCSLPQVEVPCINFVEYFKRSDEIFG